MPQLKREMFARGVRMTHRFGDNDDPFQSAEYFDAPYGNPAKAGGTKGFIGKDKGLAVYTEPFSGVTKARGGKASLSGPRLDEPDMIVERAPVSSTRRRVTAGAK